MNDIVSVAGNFEGLVTIQDLDEFPDLIITLHYLLLKESEPKLSMDEITQRLGDKYPNFPTTRQGLYYRIDGWKRDGTLRRAEELYLPAKTEEIRAAVDRAISAIPDIIDRLIEEARTGKSAKVALDITNFLLDFSQSKLDQDIKPGDQERRFIQSTKNLDPMSILKDNT